MTTLKLTARAIRGQPLGTGEYLWDVGVPGLGLRIGKHKRTWVFRWHLNQRHQYRTFGVHSIGDGPDLMSIEEARRQAAQLFARVQRGEEPFPPRDRPSADPAIGVATDGSASRPTLAVFWDQFIRDKESVGLSPKTLRMYRSHYGTHVASPEYGIAQLPLDAIGRAQIAEIRRQIASASRQRTEARLRRKEAELAACDNDLVAKQLEASIRLHEQQLDSGLTGNGAANAVVTTLSAVFSHAIDLGLLEKSVVAGFRRWPTRGSGDNFLSPSDVPEAIKLICDEITSPAHRDALLLIMLTGARHDEIRLLTWGEVQLEAGDLPPHLRLRKHKSRRRTKRDKLILLAPVAVEILRRRLPDSRKVDSPVFEGDITGAPVSELWPWWARVRVRTENPRIQRVDVHGLRHSVATLLHAQGWSLEQIGRAYEHSNIAITQRYVHETAEMYQALGNELSKALPPSLVDAGSP